MEKRKLKVIKTGGKLIEDQDKFKKFLDDFSAIEEDKILVHGGGNMATELSRKLGYQSVLVDGRRITDANGLKVILMTYGGLISKSIVAGLQARGCNAAGLCGADGRSIISERRHAGEIDYGFVGDIRSINSAFISSLLEQGITPVFSAISCTQEGELLNTNADSVAAEISKAMNNTHDTELFYCFEKKGVLSDPSDDRSVIEFIDLKKYRELLKKKIITDGMLPKLQNCFEVLHHGISEIHLGDHSLLGKDSLHTKIVK